MKRIDAIRNLMDEVTDEFVFSSCGRISREVCYIMDRPRNFYVQGSMGATIPIATGFALSKPNSQVIAIAGDGETLMGLGTLVLVHKLQKAGRLKNLSIFILDNNQFQTTGGQPTPSDATDFRLLCDCKVIYVDSTAEDIPRIPITHQEIKERFVNEAKKE